MEVGAWLVVFVDEDQSRDLAVDATLPRQFGADLDAVDGTHHDDGQVGNTECRQFFADEIRVAGRVEQVDPVGLPVAGLPFEGGDAERQRHAPFDFFGICARHRGAVFDPSNPGRDARSMQQRFDQRGLAASTVTDKHHVADALCWNDVHRLDPPGLDYLSVHGLYPPSGAPRYALCTGERTGVCYGWRVE